MRTRVDLNVPVRLDDVEGRSPTVLNFNLPDRLVVFIAAGYMPSGCVVASVEVSLALTFFIRKGDYLFDSLLDY